MGGADSGPDGSLEGLLPLLICPETGEPLELDGNCLVNASRTFEYPLIDGVPVLLPHDPDSPFRVEDVALDDAQVARSRGARREGPIRWASRGYRTHGSGEGLAEFARLLLESDRRPVRVLVIGGGRRSDEVDAIVSIGGVELIETDVYPGPAVDLLADGLRLPITDGAVDGVISQWVIEHVADPWQLVAETARVLRPGGLVYSEAPFIQQVHEGRYDFFRFTPVGHRMIYRDFEEIGMEVVQGPGMALSWSSEYFARSLRSRFDRTGLWLTRLARLLALPGLLLDRFLVRKPGAWDAASGTAFLGRKAEGPTSIREVVRGYRGINARPRG